METTTDIDSILAEASSLEVKDLRSKMESRMRTLGFIKAKIGPGNFTFRNLKHNLSLIRFIAKSYPEKMADLDPGTKVYMDPFCQEIKGCLSLMLVSIPSQGIAFFGVTNEGGITAYTTSFATAVDVFDRTSRGISSPIDPNAPLAP